MSNENRTESTSHKYFTLMVAGVIGAGLFGAWLIQYGRPMYLAESELGKVKAEIALSKAQLQEYENKLKLSELHNEITSLRGEKDKLAQIIERSEENANIYSDKVREIALTGLWKISAVSDYESNQFLEFKPNGEVFVYNKGTITIRNTSTGTARVNFTKKLISDNWYIDGSDLYISFLDSVSIGSAKNTIQAIFTGETITLDSNAKKMNLWEGVYKKSSLDSELKISGSFKRNYSGPEIAPIIW